MVASNWEPRPESSQYAGSQAYKKKNTRNNKHITVFSAGLFAHASNGKYHYGKKNSNQNAVINWVGKNKNTRIPRNKNDIYYSLKALYKNWISDPPEVIFLSRQGYGTSISTNNSRRYAEGVAARTARNKEARNSENAEKARIAQLNKKAQNAQNALKKKAQNALNKAAEKARNEASKKRSREALLANSKVKVRFSRSNNN